MKPYFDFSAAVLEKTIDEIRKAQTFIRIAMFQIHQDALFKVLNEKLNGGVSVEIITLPVESIKPNIRDEVSTRLTDLEKHGARIYFLKWNIGDPGRTTTAVEAWYSFHGKFVVTDKSAIILSANFTESPALDSMLVFEDPAKIAEFSDKFALLLDLFVTDYGGRDGKIYQKIMGVMPEEKLFQLPKDINSKHAKHWINDYPASMCPTDSPIREGLYLIPFDCRGRTIYTKTIENSNVFTYISAETFTDPNFAIFLLKVMMNKKVDLRMICGVKSQDFKDRLNNMFKDLLANGVKIKTSDEDIHSKMVVTENTLLISSINLNKMSLGYSKRKDLWRGNTESVYVCNDKDIVEEAAEKFRRIYDEYQDAGEKLSETVAKSVNDIFSNAFELKFENKTIARDFAKYLLRKELDLRKFTTGIGKIAKKLVMRRSREKIGREDILSAFILYTLSEEGRMDYMRLQSKTMEFDKTVNLNAVLNALEFDGLIIKEAENFKINPEKLV